MSDIPGGWGGIRTPGGVAPTTVFKTVAIDRSATHPKLFYRRSFNLRFCSLTAPGGAAHHSFALDCADACLADSYARPSQSTALPPIQNRCWQSQNASDILSYRFGMPACQLQTALVFYIYFL